MLAYLVTQRTREIGIRMALGARAADVLRLVLREGMAPVVLGAGAGMIAALAATRAIRSMLFGVTPLDPVSFAVAPAVLATVALLACYLPARRATRVDPLTALRDELRMDGLRLRPLGARGRIRLGLVAIVVTASVIPLLVLTRVPTPFSDVQLYASIARARQLYGVGVPTITWNSPAAVDHIPFYGPVYFDLCAAAMRVFGVSLLSFRLVSVLGTALFVAGTLLLARQFTVSRDRMLLAVALVLLTPEVNFGAAAGSMHMLALGCEMLALASFVRGFDRRRGGVRHGLAAGVWLSLAALTTPRSYPFVFAFFVAGLVPSVFASAQKAVRYRLAAAAAVFVCIMAGWAIVSHGSVYAWFRYMAYISLHEDTDVAVLPTAVRSFMFHWSALVVPVPAIGLGLLAAWSIGRRGPATDGVDAGRQSSRDGALSFLIACVWIALISTAIVLNYTFANGEYIALPMFAIVVCWPWHAFAMSRRSIAIVMGLFLCAESGYLAYRYAGVSARWQAHDPAPLAAFVERHVPPGSAVVGPEEPFFFSVEGSGSRYRTVSPRSWADWARWVPDIEPEARLLPRRFEQPVPTGRFLIWPVEGEAFPEGYECAAASVVARYDAPPPDGRFPAWLLRHAHFSVGYPTAVLYRLPPGCPSGYDPTRAPTAPSS